MKNESTCTIAKYESNLSVHLRQMDKKMWCIYSVEYYAATKKNERVPFKSTWMDLEDIMLHEVSQTEKTTAI